MRRDDVSAKAPLTIAHRAGNEPHLLRQAEAIGVDLVEADVRYHRGRIEVRHLKTMGPVPLLWDRWKLVPGWTPRFLLEDLLELVSPGTELMLDFKPGDPAFPQQVIEAVRRRLPEWQYTVCSQSWHLLEHFREEPGVRVVHSVGNRRALERVFAQLTWHNQHAVSIHQKLLSPPVVQRLLAHAPLIMTWPINDEPLLRRLQSWGVNGIISDRPALLAKLVRERRNNPSPRHP